MAELPVAYQNGTSVPDWLNKGDNSWQMVTATVVGMQSMPGLIILYGSIVKKKWAVNSAFMALYAFAAVLICWVTWAYKMSFGEQLLPFWGKAGPALGQKFLIKQAIVPPIRSRDLPTSSRHSSLQNLNPSRKRTKYSWFLLSETLSSTELTSFEPRTLKMPRALITPWPRQRPEKPRTWVTSSRLGPQHGEPGAGKQHPDRGFHVVS